MTAAQQFSLIKVNPAYWRVTFANGPVNLMDPDTVDQLAALVGDIEKDPDLTVVVFRSETPGYFMAHWDFLSDGARVAAMRPGPTGLHPYVDNFIRLSRVPVATIAEIRGRTRGVPDAELEAFTDRFARRIAAFDRVAVAGIKSLVDEATLPADEELAAGLKAYFSTAGRPEHRPFVKSLFEQGLQQPDGVEANLGAAIANR